MKRNLTILMDVDNCMLKCTDLAIELEAKAGNIIDVNNVTAWGVTGKSTDVLLRHYRDKSFYEAQTPVEGAQEFIRTVISKGHEIVVATAISGEFASIRVKKIREYFPEIAPGNIIIGARKDLLTADVLIDDAVHNIVKSKVKYPIVVRKPWNRNLTGLISVHNYDEALAFIEQISNIGVYESDEPKIYCLVGPSGSGKTCIAQKLTSVSPMYSIPRSTTTRERRKDEPENAYNFVTHEEFEELNNKGYFIETTVYAGNQYGTTSSEIDSILDSGRNAVVPIDICGANALKMKYGKRCTAVYVKRSKEELVKSLLDRMHTQLETGKEKPENIKANILNRFLSINSERKNEELCDVVLLNNKPLEDVIKFFL